MCGRFVQSDSRDAYFDALNLSHEDVQFDPEPIGRFNVAPGTSVLILTKSEENYQFVSVHWGYKPEWWSKAAMINARSETAATGRMFKPLWNTGRTIVPASGWFEWARRGEMKQPYYIHHRYAKPLFFAAIGHVPLDKNDPSHGFVIVTAASDSGLVDIHDRMPLVLSPEKALEWLDPDTSSEEAYMLAMNDALSPEEFAWYPVTNKVGSPKNQGSDLIEEIDNPIV